MATANNLCNFRCPLKIEHKMRYALLLIVLLAGCGKDDTPTPAMKHRDRLLAAKRIENHPIQPRVYEIGGNQLIAFAVSTADSDGYIDERKCFVWRDYEFKTSTMSCGSPDPVVGPEVNQ